MWAALLAALLCVGVTGLAWAADPATPRVIVDYQPPRLSVEAHGVPLAQVLGQIGARVGFTVVDNGASPSLVDVAISDATLDEVLRQLLRGENHTVLYVAGSGPATSAGARIDRIVLLGAPGEHVAAVPAAAPAQSGPAPSAAPVNQPSASVVPAPAPLGPQTATLPWTGPPVPETSPLLSWDRASSGLDVASDPADPPNTVGDLLKAHAMSALPGGLENAEASPAPAVAPTSLGAALAETTRRAQQNLGALIDGLAAATRSLQESMAKPK